MKRRVWSEGRDMITTVKMDDDTSMPLYKHLQAASLHGLCGKHV